MNVLSLFDGMSCGRIALERAGIRVDNYYASELDTHAIKVSSGNYPDIVQLGDVTLWRDWDIDWASIDLLIGGSPCQGFSLAGKELAFNDPRSVLFFVYADILNHIRTLNPYVKFLLENVKMKKQYLDVISEYLEVEPLNINSSLLTAQNRPRFYWTNLSGVVVPSDKGILVKDVLNIGDEKIGQMQPFPRNYKKLGLKRTERLEYRSDGKSNAILTNPRKNLVMRDGVVSMLAVEEAEILQTVPVGYTNQGISSTQQYRMLGNGWTIDVITYILLGGRVT